MLDGGSMIYRGFGYELTAKHKIVSAQPKKYDSGVAVAFYLPFLPRWVHDDLTAKTLLSRLRWCVLTWNIGIIVFFPFLVAHVAAT